MTDSDTPRAESRVWNPERLGYDVEGPCWTCRQKVRYFVDEDGTPRDLVGIEADNNMPRTAAETALLAALQRGDPTEKIHLASFVKGYLAAEARMTSQLDDMTTAYMVGLAKGRASATQPAPRTLEAKP